MARGLYFSMYCTKVGFFVCPCSHILITNNEANSANLFIISIVFLISSAKILHFFYSTKFIHIFSLSASHFPCSFPCSLHFAFHFSFRYFLFTTSHSLSILSSLSSISHLLTYQCLFIYFSLLSILSYFHQ